MGVPPFMETPMLEKPLVVNHPAALLLPFRPAKQDAVSAPPMLSLLRAVLRNGSNGTAGLLPLGCNWINWINDGL